MNAIVIMEVVIRLVLMRLDHFIVNATLAIHLMIMGWDVQVGVYIEYNKNILSKSTI